MTASLREIAHALGGEVASGQVLAPGPGHSPRDRSLTVRLSWQAPDGFIVYSHAGDDFGLCRDHVRARLGISTDRTSCRRDVSDRTSRRREVSNVAAPRHLTVDGYIRDDTSRIVRAVEIWAESRDPIGTVVEQYLASRGLAQGEGIAGSAIRYHPRCPWRDEEHGRTLFVPCMVAALRTIDGDHLVGIHRTRLAPDGTKLGRRMLGRASDCAIKLDGDDAVTTGLHIAEGIETALAARQLGFRPTWALGSAGAIAVFPVLPGIEALTILAEHDPANERAMAACAERWHRAGREVTVIEPQIGNDLNDAMRGAA